METDQIEKLPRNPRRMKTRIIFASTMGNPKDYPMLDLLAAGLRNSQSGNEQNAVLRHITKFNEHLAKIVKSEVLTISEKQYAINEYIHERYSNLHHNLHLQAVLTKRQQRKISLPRRTWNPDITYLVGQFILQKRKHLTNVLLNL